MHIERNVILKSTEKFIAKESLHQKSPFAYTADELRQEVADAENESESYSHEAVKAMSWKE